MAALEREGSNGLGSIEAQLTTSKDWKAVSNYSSAASTYGAEEGQVTNISSSPDTITKSPPTPNFNFW
ncbi:hypothetical protein GmHk_02G004888 [Glycine max]|nr:hypothetical protein GmHk_02G004888 [Glycine max]